MFKSPDTTQNTQRRTFGVLGLFELGQEHELIFALMRDFLRGPFKGKKNGILLPAWRLSAI